MRTTLTLDDDILAVARALADAEHRSLGEVISDLARRGLVPPAARLTEDDGFPVFSVADDAPPITSDMVETGLDEP